MLNQPNKTAVPLQKITLAMGCFWKPEALFGGMEGVTQTAVGYEGGETEDPTYWKLGLHLETVQLEINPDEINFDQILDVFFSHHSPTKPAWKRQYASALFYHSAEQEAIARRRLAQEQKRLQKDVNTLLLPYHIFYLAEDRHQKWYLQRHLPLRQELEVSFPDLKAFFRTTQATRINAFLAGFLSHHEMEALLPSLDLTEKGKQLLLAHSSVRNQRHCG